MNDENLIGVDEVKELIGLSSCLGRFLTAKEFYQITKIFDNLALRMIAECEGEE